MNIIDYDYVNIHEVPMNCGFGSSMNMIIIILMRQSAD